MSTIDESQITNPKKEYDRDPDDYARPCPHCGGITFVITLSNRLKCFECDEFLMVDEDI
jgi:ribosomal protein S27AE